jgi:hypothetical protein
MSDSVGPDNIAYASWMAAHPGVGSLLFNSDMAKQSFVLSLQDIFLLTAIFILSAIIPGFLLRKKDQPHRAPSVMAE